MRSTVPPTPSMTLAPTITARALDRARTDWLAGDPDAWERYTTCLAHLQAHLDDIAAAPDRAPATRATSRATDRRPAVRA